MSTSPPIASLGRQRTWSTFARGPAGTWVGIFVGWTVFGLCSFVTCLLANVGIYGETDRWQAVLAYSLGAAWIWAILTPLVLRAIRSAPIETGQRFTPGLVYAITGTAFVLASTLLQNGILRMISPGMFNTNMLAFTVQNSLLAFGALVLLAQTTRYFNLFKTRQVQTSELEARLSRTHLQLLRMQLQPHFLFNTLNTVAELVHSDPDTADQMVTRLGRLLRMSLDHAGHQVVPLRQEIDFLRMYVEIEQIRFQERLQIVWDLGPDTLDAAVPTLLWHPVLENAIRHGVTPLAGKGRIVIASRLVGEDLILEIRDNGRGLPTGAILREGVGLRNIRERVDQLYGARARFTLEPALGGGTIATLQLPYTHCDGAHTPLPLSQQDLKEVMG